MLSAQKEAGENIPSSLFISVLLNKHFSCACTYSGSTVNPRPQALSSANPSRPHRPGAATIDFIRAVAAGDRLGTGLALLGFVPGPNPGAFDDIVEGLVRNADEVVPEEFADEILSIGGGTNPFAARTRREVSLRSSSNDGQHC
jgi:hypothetical protein